MRETTRQILLSMAFLLLFCSVEPSLAQNLPENIKAKTSSIAPKSRVSSARFYKIIVQGNKRVDEETVKSYVLSQADFQRNFSDAVQKSLKRLYESDLFLESKIYRAKGRKIIVEVKENPIISEVKFVGNNKIEDDDLAQEVSLKKRGTYSKSKLQNDLKRISEIYLKSGRFLTKIEPKIIDKEQGRVEIVFDIFEGKTAKISEIVFIGNNAFSDDDLKQEITTRESKWWKFLSSADVYDSDRIEFDKEKLRRFYGSKGYADFAAISSIAQITPEKDRFFITFLVEEGVKYRIGDLKIINQIDKFDETELYDEILLKKGKVYNSELVEKTVDGMIEVMSDKSYAFADIEPVLKRNREEKIMDIDFVIRETPRIYINQIRISGNTRTIDKVIRRELRFREGDPYNITRINRSKQRINNLGFFEKVDLETKRIGDTDKVDVEIKVKEKKTGELTLGVGFSTVNGVTANTGIKENNLFGTGRELGFSVQKSSFTFSGDVSYQEPYFMNRPINVGFNLYQFQRNRRFSLFYAQESSGLKLNGNYAITEFMYHSVYYSLSNQKVYDIDYSVSSSVLANIQNLEGSFTSSAFGHSLIYDKRDNRLNPKDGYYVSVTQELSGFGGDIKILKNEAAAGFYTPTINDDFIFKLSARAGMVDGIGQDVRSNYGYFLGGNNFRGFEYAGLGPRVVTNGSAKNGAAVGGKKYYVGTAELMFPLGLPKDLGINGMIFSDNGTLYGVDSINRNGNEIVDSASLRSSYGFSIVWASPMGPIRLDFSRIAKKEDYDDTQFFRFNFGTTF